MEFLKVLLAILFVLISANNRICSQTWDGTNGPGGSVVKTIINPNDPNTIFAISASAFFKSSDGGLSWKPSTKGFDFDKFENTNRQIEDFSVDESFPDTIFVCINQPQKYGKSFLYSSYDSGSNWKVANEAIIHSVCAKNGYVFALSESGILFSSDAGNTWEVRNDTILGEKFSTIVIDEEDIIWVKEFNCLFKSNDYGRTFQKLTYPGVYKVQSFDVAVANKQKLIAFSAIFGNIDSRDSILISRDEGRSWYNCSNSLNIGIYGIISTIKLSRHNPDNIIAGTSNGFFRTTNTGLTWTDLSKDLILPHAILPNVKYKPIIYSLSISNKNPELIIAGTSNDGVFQSKNYGENWRFLSIPSTSSYSLTISTEGELYSSSSGGIFMLKDKVWAPTSMLGGSSYVNISPVQVCPYDSRILFCGVETNIFNPILYKSTDKGITWSERLIYSYEGYFTKIIFDPLDSNKIFAAHKRGLAISNDQGETWSNLQLLTGYTPIDLQISRVNNKIVYLLRWDGQVDKSTDGGNSWKEIKTKIDSQHTCIRIDPNNDNIIYLASFFLFKSIDGGDNWVKLPFDKKITDIVIDQSTGELFIGTYREGVWISNDGGNTFSKMPELPSDRIKSLLIYKTNTSKILFVGTANLGCYQYNLALSSVIQRHTTPMGNYNLFENYPNPFNSSTKFEYQIISTSLIKLEIYDVLGNKIKTLVNAIQSPGRYSVLWDANKGNLPSGIYFSVLKQNDIPTIKKLIYLK